MLEIYVIGDRPSRTSLTVYLATASFAAQSQLVMSLSSLELWAIEHGPTPLTVRGLQSAIIKTVYSKSGMALAWDIHA
jgi:hypothetical protein